MQHINDPDDIGVGPAVPAEVPVAVEWTEELKVLLDWRAAWEPLITGAVSPSGDLKARCPVHEDYDPSASVNFARGAWQCFSCGESGYFDSAAGDELLDELLTDPPAWASGGRGYVGGMEVQHALPSPDEMVAAHERLLSERYPTQVAYLTGKRALAYDALAVLKVGWDSNALCFPVFAPPGRDAAPDSVVVGVKYRTVAKGNKRTWSARGSTGGLFGWSLLSDEAADRLGPDLLIVEGEIDVLTAVTLGMRAMSPSNGSGQIWDPLWFDRIAEDVRRRGGTVYIVPDADEQGLKFSRYVRDGLRSKGIRVKVLDLKLERFGRGSDLNDLWRDIWGEWLEQAGPGDPIFPDLETPAHRAMVREMRIAGMSDPAKDGEPEAKLEAGSKTASDEPNRIEQLADAQHRIEYEAEVQKKLRDRLAFHDAEQRVELEQARRAWVELMGGGPDSLEQMLDEEIPWRIEELAVVGHNTLIVGQKKAGKTTLMMNLTRSLITGEPFLGSAVKPVDPGMRVMYLNYEVGERQFARWLADHGMFEGGVREGWWSHSLRGRALDLSSEFDRGKLAEELIARRTQVLVVDPFARAFGGEENSNTEVSEFTDGLDTLAKDAGLTDVFLVTHSGKNGSGARGASRLEDWADSIWKYGKTKDRRRRLDAEGRDVEVTGWGVDYDAEARRLARGAAASSGGGGAGGAGGAGGGGQVADLRGAEVVDGTLVWGYREPEDVTAEDAARLRAVLEDRGELDGWDDVVDAVWPGDLPNGWTRASIPKQTERKQVLRERLVAAVEYAGDMGWRWDLSGWLPDAGTRSRFRLST